MVPIFINGCGSSSDGKKLINELNLKCSSINLSKIKANCSMAKRASADNIFFESGIYDKMSNDKLLEELRSLEIEFVDCTKQMSNQGKWIW